jgi:hypothetical protein
MQVFGIFFSQISTCQAYKSRCIGLVQKSHIVWPVCCLVLFVKKIFEKPALPIPCFICDLLVFIAFIYLDHTKLTSFVNKYASLSKVADSQQVRQQVRQFKTGYLLLIDKNCNVVTEHLCRVKGSPNRNSCSAKVKQTCVLNWLPFC